MATLTDAGSVHEQRRVSRPHIDEAEDATEGRRLRRCIDMHVYEHGSCSRGSGRRLPCGTAGNKKRIAICLVFNTCIFNEAFGLAYGHFLYHKPSYELVAFLRVAQYFLRVVRTPTCFPAVHSQDMMNLTYGALV